MPARLPKDKDQLPDDVAGSAGAALGQDFSNVTVHEDGEAEKLGTRAFARGNKLHFAAGAYQPTTPDGVALIGHELTHVAQQRDGRVAPSGTAQGVAVNTDAALESEADAGGAAVAQGFDLGGFLDFGSPGGGGRDVAAPVAQGSDITPDAAPEGEAPAEAPAEQLELADVLGPDYEADRQLQEDDYFEAYAAASDAADLARVKSATAVAKLDDELATSNLLPSEINACEQAVLASAQQSGGEPARATTEALTDARDELDAYTEVLLAEAKFWSLYAALPFLEGFAKIWEGWVNLLKDFDGTAKIAFEARTGFDALFNKWHDELSEAKAKVGIDAVSIFADVLLATAPISGGLGAVLGLAVGGAGLVMGHYLEPDEGFTAQNYTNGALQVGDYARQARELDPKDLSKFKFVSPEVVAKIQGMGFAKGEGVFEGTMTTILKGLGTAIDAGSLTSDAAEMMICKKMVAELTTSLEDWSTKYAKLVQVWPLVVEMLLAAVPLLDRLHAALANSGPALDAAWGDVLASRKLL